MVICIDFTEVSHVVQVRAEGPKAPTQGKGLLSFTFPLCAGDRWFWACGTYKRNLSISE